MKYGRVYLSKDVTDKDRTRKATVVPSGSNPASMLLVSDQEASVASDHPGARGRDKEGRKTQTKKGRAVPDPAFYAERGS
jgi:hypothetical protein